MTKMANIKNISAPFKVSLSFFSICLLANSFGGLAVSEFKLTDLLAVLFLLTFFPVLFVLFENSLEPQYRYIFKSGRALYIEALMIKGIPTYALALFPLGMSLSIPFHIEVILGGTIIVFHFMYYLDPANIRNRFQKTVSKKIFDYLRSKKKD
ncbi:MAG: hypothetical protein H6624_03340 [Bdellovibrionaceae bacterium]|nr:hypothetical protein [Bdellovibrionales bacterium]MCB9083349.1 hypothetical protein [Pseudobdellovibrionaceae bacterium]